MSVILFAVLPVLLYSQVLLPHNNHVETNTKPSGGYEAYMDHGNAQESFCVALQQAGYKTAMMGKFLNGYLPRNINHFPVGQIGLWLEQVIAISITTSIAMEKFCISEMHLKIILQTYFLLVPIA
jgi:hypothetical protein